MIPRLPTLGHQRSGARAHNANGKSPGGGGARNAAIFKNAHKEIGSRPNCYQTAL